jgi:hypothetical protein
MVIHPAGHLGAIAQSPHITVALPDFARIRNPSKYGRSISVADRKFIRLNQ